MFRLTWTDVGLALLLAIPATAIPDTAPRSDPPLAAEAELAERATANRG